ncbi:MAG: GNAT family N-acetyltransferase [Lachnospiraceae bacterium]|nr:GNAT family N-acetyltransferase [Lachnospiraceae bacterium]
MIREITIDEEKREISRKILEGLQEWFAVPESREAYIAGSAGKIFFAAFDDDEETPIGFLYLKETGKETVELAVMGVAKEKHRRGTGKKLFEAAKKRAGKLGYDYLQVKTVQEGMYPDYDDTNKFYRALGFKEFEVIPEIWGKDNPCQIYIMSL